MVCLCTEQEENLFEHLAFERNISAYTFFDAMELGLQFDDEDLDFTALKLGSKRDARGSENYDPKQCAPEAS